MKRRSREINIFSMSALDLFASALGAFILISVVLFPFFPNIGSSEEQVAKIKEDLQKAKDQIGALEGRNKSLEAQIAALKAKELDLVVCLDVTNSMGAQIAGIRQEILQMVRILSAMSPSVGVGVVAFGDRQWRTSAPTTSFKLREVGRDRANRQQLQEFVNSLKPGMNTRPNENEDQEEAVGMAIAEAIQMPWRSESRRRVIVVITDNPGYREEWDAIFSRTRSFAASQVDSRLSTVFVDSGKNSQPGTSQFLDRLASMGKGKLVRSTGSMTVDIIDSFL